MPSTSEANYDASNRGSPAAALCLRPRPQYRAAQRWRDVSGRCLRSTSAQALLEARRVADGPIAVEHLSAEEFEKLLLLSYQRDSAEARRMMADIGNELDLYTLAEELPDTDDLLDSEDDAPIIRLINAMLTEAIKEKASDIHIETYERHLQIPADLTH